MLISIFYILLFINITCLEYLENFHPNNMNDCFNKKHARKEYCLIEMTGNKMKCVKKDDNIYNEITTDQKLYCENEKYYFNNKIDSVRNDCSSIIPQNETQCYNVKYEKDSKCCYYEDKEKIIKGCVKVENYDEKIEWNGLSITCYQKIIKMKYMIMFIYTLIILI